MHVHLNEFHMVMAFVVGSLAAARITRLLTQDTYPPVAWLRTKWEKLTHDGEWAVLATCPYCAAPWISLAIGATGVLTDFPVWWWLGCVWLAASYVAAIVVAYDGE